MKKTLEALWYEYQMELPEKPSEEEKDILKTLNAAEEKLLAELNDNQAHALITLENCLDKLDSFAERKAFIRGIRFATGYLIEAMQGE